MRDGRVVDHRATADSRRSSLARAMVGREVSLRGERSALGFVSADGRRRRSPIAPVAPDVRRGAAHRRCRPARPRRAGAPRRASASRSRPGRSSDSPASRATASAPRRRAVQPACRSTPGASRSTGSPCRPVGPGRWHAAGVAVVPEDRHDSGMRARLHRRREPVHRRSGRVARHGLMDRGEMRQRAAALIDRFAIVCAGPDAPMWSLSGGNQQRVVLARELSHGPRVLVAAQPTRGLDVGAIEYMSGRFSEAAASGVGVLLISTRARGGPRPVRPHRRDVARARSSARCRGATSTSSGWGCSWAAPGPTMA